MRKDCEPFKQKLNRVSGQVNGIANMIEGGRPVEDILPQVQAARAALSRVALDLLKDDAESCFEKGSQKHKLEKFEELVKSFFKITN